MDKCKNCGAQIWAEHWPQGLLGLTWVDNTYSDVCKQGGENKLHEPLDEE